MDQRQHDSLKVVLNNGLDRASAVLREITGSRMNVVVPSVVVCPPDQLDSHVGISGKTDVFAVCRSFSGVLSGDVLLVLTGLSGRVLTNSLCFQLMAEADTDCDTNETVSKIGAVITNHFINTWASLLADHFDCGTPSFQLCSLESVVKKYGAVESPDHEIRRAVCAQTQVDVPDFTVAASLVVMLKKDSLDRLIGSVSKEPER